MGYEKPRANDTRAEKWSEDEEEELLRLGDETDLTIDEITERFDGRSRQAIKNKLRKLRKARGTYNSPHEDEKHALNERWIKEIVTNIDGDIRAFEGYTGTGGSSLIYLDYVAALECCEIEEEIFEKLVSSVREAIGPPEPNADADVARFQSDDKRVICYNDNVNNVLHRKVGNNDGDYQFIDLDPCGSPFVSVPQALRLIEDGYLAVTYGDLHLQRWGRHAPLSKAYRMPSVDSFEEVIEYMIAWTMFEGVRQEASTKTRKVEVVDVELLSEINSGVARVLYKVDKKRSLAPVMNYLENELQEIEEGSSPMAARYDVSSFLK